MLKRFNVPQNMYTVVNVMSWFLTGQTVSTLGVSFIVAVTAMYFFSIYRLQAPNAECPYGGCVLEGNLGAREHFVVETSRKARTLLDLLLVIGAIFEDVGCRGKTRRAAYITFQLLKIAT